MEVLNAERSNRMPSQESRQKLRPWLKRILDENLMNGVKWINSDEGKFKILWPHKLKTNWDEKDAEVFMEWARQTGRYNAGVTSKDYTTWKTNLRCALNKCPDIDFLGEEAGENNTPCRIYCMKSTAKTEKKKSEVQRVTDSSSATVEGIGLDNSYFGDIETINSSNRPTVVKLLDEKDTVIVKTELCLDDVAADDDGLYGIQMSLGSLHLSREINYGDVVMNSDTGLIEDFTGVILNGQLEVAPIPQNTPDIPTTVFGQADASYMPQVVTNSDTNQILLLMQQMDPSAFQPVEITDALPELNFDLSSADIQAATIDSEYIERLLDLL